MTAPGVRTVRRQLELAALEHLVDNIAVGRSDVSVHLGERDAAGELRHLTSSRADAELVAQALSATWPGRARVLWAGTVLLRR